MVSVFCMCGRKRCGNRQSQAWSWRKNEKSTTKKKKNRRCFLGVFSTRSSFWKNVVIISTKEVERSHDQLWGKKQTETERFPGASSFFNLWRLFDDPGKNCWGTPFRTGECFRKTAQRGGGGRMVNRKPCSGRIRCPAPKTVFSAKHQSLHTTALEGKNSRKMLEMGLQRGWPNRLGASWQQLAILIYYNVFIYSKCVRQVLREGCSSVTGGSRTRIQLGGWLERAAWLRISTSTVNININIILI